MTETERRPDRVNASYSSYSVRWTVQCGCAPAGRHRPQRATTAAVSPLCAAVVTDGRGDCGTSAPYPERRPALESRRAGLPIGAARRPSARSATSAEGFRRRPQAAPAGGGDGVMSKSDLLPGIRNNGGCCQPAGLLFSFVFPGHSYCFFFCGCISATG